MWNRFLNYDGVDHFSWKFVKMCILNLPVDTSVNFNDIFKFNFRKKFCWLYDVPNFYFLLIIWSGKANITQLNVFRWFNLYGKVLTTFKFKFGVYHSYKSC